MNIHNQRILITGSGGVLGTALTAQLQGHASTLPLRRIDCDLADGQQVDNMWRLWRPTLIFHLAANVAGIAGNSRHPADIFHENILINTHVIDAAAKRGAKKIVVAGTVAIYPCSKERLSETQIWDGPPHPSEFGYAHSKRAMLAHLEACKEQYGLDFAYLICTNLYGQNDRFDEENGHVVPSIISRVQRAVSTKSQILTVWGDGTPTRDLLFATDAARAFLTAAASGRGPINVATGRSITIAGLVKRLVAISGYAGKISWQSDKPNGQLSRSYDTSRINNLGWHPTTKLTDGLRQTYAWYIDNRSTVRR